MVIGDDNPSWEMFRTKRSREQAGLDTSNRCRHPLSIAIGLILLVKYYWSNIGTGSGATFPKMQPRPE